MLFIHIILFAQDDLLNELNQEIKPKQRTEYVYATFKTSRIIHGQSVELIPKGNLNFIIGHRFGKINDGFNQFFGLDQSTMRLGFEYGIFNWLNIGVGRSSFMKTYDGSLKYRILRQSKGQIYFPLTVTFFTNIAINDMPWSEPDRVNYFSSRISYEHQVLIARKISNALSIQISPSLVHRNLVDTKTDPNDVFAVGIGGRLKLSTRVSFNVEYYYQLPDYQTENNFNSIALGFDIETGGHIFQLQVTNSQGMIGEYFIPETFGDIRKGDIYFGFNINRIFTVKNPN